MRQTHPIRPTLTAFMALWLAGCGQSLPSTTAATPPAPVYIPPATTAASPTAAPTDPTACGRDKPAGNPTIGTSRQGDYMGQQLPQGYNVYGSEAEVTAAIQKLYDAGGDWACFQAFYPGASTVFKRKGRLKR